MFIPDTPITAVNEDKLGRTKFAIRLAETLSNWQRHESIVIGLYGPWGSGKTSIVNMTVEQILSASQSLPEENKPIIVSFNPWNFSEQNQLLLMFFTQLLSEIEADGPKKWRNLRDTFDKYGSYLAATSDVPTIGKYIGSIGKLLKKTEDTPFQLRKDIDNAFRELQQRVIITLDDLDRLTTREIRQVFQLIKLNANFPNTIYLIAADRTVIEKSLDTEQGVSGRAYLEKIVQVGFDIPPIDPTYISELLDNEFEKVIEDNQDAYFDNSQWSELYSSGFKLLFQTLRDLKRYTNSLTFNLTLVSSEINLVDFIGIEALRVFTPEVYEAIRINKAVFTSIRNWNQQEELAKYVESIVSLGGLHTNVCRAIVRHLFPQINGLYNNMFYGLDHLRLWKGQRRVCVPDVFDTYFLLSVPQKEVSQVEINEIIASAENPERLKELVSDIVTDSRFPKLSDRLQEVSKQITPLGARNMVEVILSLSSNLPDLDFSLREIGTDLRVAIFINTYLESIDEADRCPQFIKIIDASDATAAIVKYLSLSDPSQGGASQYTLFTEDCLEKLKEKALGKIINDAHSGILLQNPKLVSILHQWRKWSDDAGEVENFIQYVTSDEDSFLQLLASFLKPVQQGTLFGETVSTAWRIDLNELETFIDLNSIDALLENIPEERFPQLTERQQLAVTTYKQMIEYRNSTLAENTE